MSRVTVSPAAAASATASVDFIVIGRVAADTLLIVAPISPEASVLEAEGRG